MKENLKGALVALSMLVGFLLMLGGEGGIVQGSLTGDSGWWVMAIGLLMFAAPIVVGVWMQGKEGCDDEEEDRIG